MPPWAHGASRAPQYHLKQPLELLRGIYTPAAGDTSFTSGRIVRLELMRINPVPSLLYDLYVLHRPAHYPAGTLKTA